MDEALFEDLGRQDLEADSSSRWPMHPVNTWVLMKGLVYFVCTLSFLDSLGNVVTLIGWAQSGHWAAFVVTLCLVTCVSCVTTAATAFADHGTYGAADRAQDRGIMDSDGGRRGAVMAFFKLGAFRIAYRILWYLDRAEVMAAAGTWTDEDLCEHFLPLFIYVAAQAMVETWPILLIKCYMLGLSHGTTSGEGTVADSPALAASALISIALLAIIPVFVDKISCDYRQVYVRGQRSTALGKRFLGMGRCALLFTFRYAEALSWYISLAMFAWVFHGWFWMIWAADLVALSCVYCVTADISEEDWEVALAIKIFFQVFYTAPQHSESSDMVLFFRPQTGSRFSSEATYFPAVLHFAWRLMTQGIIVLCICTAGRGDWLDEVQWQAMQPWLQGMAAITAFTWLLLPVTCWIMPSSDIIVAGIVERKYLLHSQRPDGVAEELFQAVLAQEIEKYVELVEGQPLSIRAWVLHEHARRAMGLTYGGERFQMELKRSTLVQSVLDSVDAATQAQLRRGPRVTFSDDGEIGDDQGGVTREMFAEFARRCALPDPGETRLLKVTPANHVQPEPCLPAEPDCNDSATGSGTGTDVQYGRHYRNLGRVCGMALWTGDLLDVSFAPFFLKLVIDPERRCSFEENRSDLADEDPELWRSMSAMLTAAEGSTTPDEEFGVMFERTISSSDCNSSTSAGAATNAASDDTSSAVAMAKKVQPRVVELIEGGSDVPVTHANARDFVEKYLHHKMCISVLPQARAFRRGLLDVLGDEVLLRIFSAAELSQLLGGQDAIDKDALHRWRRDSTLTDDAQGNEEAIDWFWQSLDVMSQEERGKVLAFATGCPRMPLGPVGPTFVLNVHPHEDPNALPTAHTCTNTINLPPYPSQDKLLERLRIAISDGVLGFGLA